MDSIGGAENYGHDWSGLMERSMDDKRSQGRDFAGSSSDVLKHYKNFKFLMILNYYDHILY